MRFQTFLFLFFRNAVNSTGINHYLDRKLPKCILLVCVLVYSACMPPCLRGTADVSAGYVHPCTRVVCGRQVHQQAVLVSPVSDPRRCQLASCRARSGFSEGREGPVEGSGRSPNPLRSVTRRGGPVNAGLAVASRRKHTGSVCPSVSCLLLSVMLMLGARHVRDVARPLSNLRMAWHVRNICRKNYK